MRASFVAGERGEWRIERISSVIGESLPAATHLARHEDHVGGGTWSLHGVRSNQRYTNHGEATKLVAIQADLARPTSTCGALIPIRKTAAWWQLAQDERRTIFEHTSRHIAIGLEYLPAVARRLYHSRDLGEPFDFLTWFEFAPADRDAFDELVARLRATEEWRYVEREVDIRVTR